MNGKILRSLLALMICVSLVLNFSSIVLADDVLIGAGEFDGENYAEMFQFPIFSNEVDYSRGGITTDKEEYLDYKASTADRHVFSDMIYHKSEVSAVRLAEKGIFEKTATFNPDGSMKVIDFVRALLKLCGKSGVANSSDNEVIGFIEKTALIGGSVNVDFSADLTNEYLAYFLGQAVENTDNAAQYQLLLDDYDSITATLRGGVLDSIAAGITEIVDFKLNPKAVAKRSDIADGLYRLYNAAARVIPLFDLGSAYDEKTDSYVVKSTYEKNEGGLQQGFFTSYDKQNDAFLNYGNLPINRTGFYKWANIEKKDADGNIYYDFNFAFNNDKNAHKAGNTVINCIDISANREWNNLLSESYIPSWYTQDITNETTRAAAKEFLYAFVTKMLTEISGDVILAIDYEVDNFLGLWESDWGKEKANAFAEWFAEACTVARKAAADLNKSDNLKLMVIYNRVTNLHRLGVEENQWMLDIAEVADYIGLDSYDFYEDKTDASVTLECIRFMMNNYSLNKPFIVVENGVKMQKDLDSIDSVTGLTQMQMATQYYKNLYREFRFALEKGDFLNANLSGFLFWSYYDTNEESETTCGVTNADNTLRDNGIAIKEGINSLYKQKQFNPSVLKSVSAVTETTPITVKSGTEYDEITIIAQGSGHDGTGAVSVKLDKAATVFVTVNGEEYFTDNRYAEKILNHSVEVKNLKEGTNVIKIRFGNAATPFDINLLEAKLYFNEISDWTTVQTAPENSLIAGKEPYTIVKGNGSGDSNKNAHGGSPLTLWTNGDLTDDVNGLRYNSSKGLTMAYHLGGSYAVRKILLSSGGNALPTQTKWKAYVADDYYNLFNEENCIAYVTNDAKMGQTTQYVDVNKNKVGKFFGIKLIDNGVADVNTYISEIGVYLLEGDVNLDGYFDARDVVHLKKHIAGAITAKNISSGDYDGNGKLDAADLTSMRNVMLNSLG